MPKRPLPAPANMNVSGPHLASTMHIPAVSVKPEQGAKKDSKMDGMNALLKAGEIVDRRTSLCD